MLEQPSLLQSKWPTFHIFSESLTFLMRSYFPSHTFGMHSFPSELLHCSAITHPLKTWWAPFFTLAFPELQLETDRAGAQRPSHPLPSPPWRRASREPANTSLPYTSCPGPAVPGVEHWGGQHLKEGLILDSSCLKCDRTNLSHKISLNDFTFTPAMFSDHDGLKLEISYRKVSEKSSNTWN